MEQYYIKRGNRYIPAGYSIPDMGEGLYFKQKTDFGTRTTSIPYWVGSIQEKPIDVEKLISLMKNDDSLAQFIMKLTDEKSEEFKAAQTDENLNLPLKFYNWSATQLSHIILRFLYEKLK